MKTLSALFMIAGLVAAAPVLASEDLAKQHKCTNCHDASAKKMGPTWKDIAAKRRGDRAAVLAAIKGGSKGGVYGKAPMPSQAKVGDDAEKLADWVLTH